MNESKEPWDIPPALPSSHPDRLPIDNEDIRRVPVDPEDRLAFRVGVNFITLVLIGVGIYFLIRYLRG